MLPPTLSRRNLAPASTEEIPDNLLIARQLLNLRPIRGRVLVRIRGAGRESGNPVHDQRNRRGDRDTTDLEAGLGDGDAVERRAIWFLGT